MMPEGEFPFSTSQHRLRPTSTGAVPPAQGQPRSLCLSGGSPILGRVLRALLLGTEGNSPLPPLSMVQRQLSPAPTGAGGTVPPAPGPAGAQHQPIWRNPCTSVGISLPQAGFSEPWCWCKGRIPPSPLRGPDQVQPWAGETAPPPPTYTSVTGVGLRRNTYLGLGLGWGTRFLHLPPAPLG